MYANESLPLLVIGIIVILSCCITIGYVQLFTTNFRVEHFCHLFSYHYQFL